jgi:hypothetical protein
MNLAMRVAWVIATINREKFYSGIRPAGDSETRKKI